MIDESVRTIEVDFAVPVVVNREQERRLVELLDEIARAKLYPVSWITAQRPLPNKRRTSKSTPRRRQHDSTENR